jgi:hypothetical protein
MSYSKIIPYRHILASAYIRIRFYFKLFISTGIKESAIKSNIPSNLHALQPGGVPGQTTQHISRSFDSSLGNIDIRARKHVVD